MSTQTKFTTITDAILDEFEVPTLYQEDGRPNSLKFTSDCPTLVVCLLICLHLKLTKLYDTKLLLLGIWEVVLAPSICSWNNEMEGPTTLAGSWLGVIIRRRVWKARRFGSIARLPQKHTYLSFLGMGVAIPTIKLAALRCHMARVEGPDGLANTFGMIGSGLGPQGLRGLPCGEPHATRAGGMGQRMVIGYDHVQLREFIHVDLSSSFIGRSPLWCIVKKKYSNQFHSAM